MALWPIRRCAIPRGICSTFAGSNSTLQPLKWWAKKREDLLGEHLLTQFPFLQSEGIFAEYVQVVETGQSLNKEYYLAQFESWIQMFVVKLDDGLAVTFRNTTERKNLELTLARQAEQDGLTGIANRRVFALQLTQEWRAQYPLAKTPVFDHV
jgi:two-component system cell cycle response regulator